MAKDWIKMEDTDQVPYAYCTCVSLIPGLCGDQFTILDLSFFICKIAEWTEIITETSRICLPFIVKKNPNQRQYILYKSMEFWVFSRNQ